MSASPKATLEHMLKLLGFPATITEQSNDDGLTLDVQTEESGRLIGRQGQTLADLQYLLNRIVFQQETTAPRVTVDVAGYRAQAREALVQKAKEAAEKVRKWGDIVEMEPMNAYDRRLVHHALRDEPDVETASVEVEGTTRKAILVRPKR